LVEEDLVHVFAVCVADLRQNDGVIQAESWYRKQVCV
jgi:hypothetical protein